DPSDESLRREVDGWHTMAGPLGDDLVPTMSALPWYPHEPWTHVAPDFFQLFEHVSFEGRRVVDLGAGRTWASRFLATVGRAGEVVAVDVLTRKYLGLETADVFFQQDGIHFERLRGDVHRLPLVDGWADAVVGVAAVHHSGRLEDLFAEIRRILRPGGLFVMVSEPVKKASIPDRQPQNAETAHGINEHMYSFAEYTSELRRAGFSYDLLSPRTVRYRLLYRDDDFESGLPPALRKISRSKAGRGAIARLLRGRRTGPLLYRYCNLPLSLIARSFAK
ncbi:MAG: class I SAM-dependent methyltransferase, partial [Deltaproteobacteria bacterium]|nr:class I SAM-dependent methyltransferase [Deltaproteobacteria bacterium]